MIKNNVEFKSKSTSLNLYISVHCIYGCDGYVHVSIFVLLFDCAHIQKVWQDCG